jgi:capsular exopolysaccharide synthesis family protein
MNDEGSLMSSTWEKTPDDSTPVLREYLSLLRVRKWVILAVAALVLAGALGMSARQTPIYESHAQILVKPIETSISNLPVAPNLETERRLASSEAVAKIALRSLDSTKRVDALLDNVSVDVATSTEILELRFSDPNPKVAQEGAQTFAEAYLHYRREEALDEIVAASNAIRQRIDARTEQLKELQSKLSETGSRSKRAEFQAQADALETQIAILEQEAIDVASSSDLSVGQIVGPADLPSNPVTPNYARNGGLALIAGLALGVGVAFLLERLDDRLRGRDELEALTGAPVLAVVPRVHFWKKRHDSVLVSVLQPQSPAAEAYKSLRTGVLYSAQRNGVKVILVTSPQAGEGKTATTANLGVALSQAAKKVVAISADLRKPRLHLFLETPNEPGLADVLAGRTSPFEAMLKKYENLHIIASGSIPENPAELLGSEAMGHLLKTLRDQADFVLIDAPPLLAVTDAVALASFADGVLFVADGGASTKGSVKQALKQLEHVNAPLIGSVLNSFDPAREATYSSYGYRPYQNYEEDQHAGTSMGNGASLGARLRRRRS